ncbi:flavodoxin [Candidatus Avoscillospira sp. LCP25S3_F1]|uniref:flavodoxin n=1 Tax=Candidatus Avoscillospira sp. LCP25S3_F1 TaxID=3438825 RepID=UPI003F934635
MSKIAVVYWSGTGNTEAMAAAVAQGVSDAGGEAVVKTAAEFTAETLDQFDAVAFGCPSMGAEELEETEFAPMFERCRGGIRGKRLGLFGSYGWGDGEWMRNWQEQVRADGADLVSDGVICNEAPDDEAVTACQALGRTLAS